jgi:hypothetical protein
VFLCLVEDSETRFCCEKAPCLLTRAFHADLTCGTRLSQHAALERAYVPILHRNVEVEKCHPAMAEPDGAVPFAVPNNVACGHDCLADLLVHLATKGAREAMRDRQRDSDVPEARPIAVAERIEQVGDSASSQGIPGW